MKIDLTEQEAAVLNQLIDVAVRAQGLQVAEAAVVLSQRILQAVRDSSNSVPTPQVQTT